MEAIEVGKEYDVDHRRKGLFTIRVDAVDAVSVVGTITKGIAKYMSEPDRQPGDKIELMIDSSFVNLTPASE